MIKYLKKCYKIQDYVDNLVNIINLIHKIDLKSQNLNFKDKKNYKKLVYSYIDSTNNLNINSKESKYATDSDSLKKIQNLLPDKKKQKINILVGCYNNYNYIQQLEKVYNKFGYRFLQKNNFNDTIETNYFKLYNFIIGRNDINNNYPFLDKYDNNKKNTNIIFVRNLLSRIEFDVKHKCIRWNLDKNWILSAGNLIVKEINGKKYAFIDFKSSMWECLVGRIDHFSCISHRHENKNNKIDGKQFITKTLRNSKLIALQIKYTFNYILENFKNNFDTKIDYLGIKISNIANFTNYINELEKIGIKFYKKYNSKVIFIKSLNNKILNEFEINQLYDNFDDYEKEIIFNKNWSWDTKVKSIRISQMNQKKKRNILELLKELKYIKVEDK